jgi:hypothetical protein
VLASQMMSIPERPPRTIAVPPGSVIPDAVLSEVIGAARFDTGYQTSRSSRRPRGLLDGAASVVQLPHARRWRCAAGLAAWSPRRSCDEHHGQHCVILCGVSRSWPSLI